MWTTGYEICLYIDRCTEVKYLSFLLQVLVRKEVGVKIQSKSLEVRQIFYDVAVVN